MPTTLDRIAGLRLREVRERRGYTQQELAFALHVTPTQIRHWEKGNTPLSVARIDQLARSLHVTPAALRMMPLPPNRERELIRLADAFNGLDFSGLNPIQGMVRRWLRCSKATPMNWHDVETVLALALKRDPRSSFAASRRNLQGVRFKKITMRDQPDGSQIDEAVVEAR